MDEIKKEIQSFLKGDALDDDETLSKYSKDYSLFQIKPKLVVFPKNSEDLKNLVNFAVRKKKSNSAVSLTARSAGTDMTGGPLNNSIIVEFTKYFNRIKEIKDDYAVVEPGVYFSDFEKNLESYGLFYPPYPASKDLCAIGGMIANNSGGEKTLAYGKTEDYVQKLKTVLNDGNEYEFSPLSKTELEEKIKIPGFEGKIYRELYELISKNYDLVKKARPNVSKNSAGYALWDVWDGKTFNIAKLIVWNHTTIKP